MLQAMRCIAIACRLSCAHSLTLCCPRCAPALLAPPHAAGGLTEALLMQLGKLPALKGVEGRGSDTDTDRDAGSEATELDDMDVC